MASPLRADSRTRAAAGPMVRLTLAGNAQALFNELGPAEVVRAFCVPQKPSGVLAVTDRRVILVASDGSTMRLPKPLEVLVGDAHLTGRAATLVADDNTRLDIVASENDLTKLGSRAAPEEHFPHHASGGPGAVHDRPTVSAIGLWRWHRPVTNWQDAERLAADHMVHLGFAGAMLTPPGADGGVDVIAEGAAAQVKHQGTTVTSPMMREFAGSAERVPTRLYYSYSGYTDQAIKDANGRQIALFVFGLDGSVAPLNDLARTLAPAPVVQRAWYEPASLDERVAQCLRWSHQICGHVATAKISDRDSRARKQLAQREAAMRAVVQATEKLQSVGNPIFKEGRRRRIVSEAESLLAGAAAKVGLRLKR